MPVTHREGWTDERLAKILTFVSSAMISFMHR